MKSNNTTENTTSRYLMPGRWFVTFIGIVIAIACSVVLLRDDQISAPDEALSKNLTGFPGMQETRITYVTF